MFINVYHVLLASDCLLNQSSWIQVCVEGGWATAFASRRCNTLHGSGTKTSSDHQSKFVIDKRRTFSGLCGLLSRTGKRVALKKFSFENGFSLTMSYFEFHLFWFVLCYYVVRSFCLRFLFFFHSFGRFVFFLHFFLSRSVSPFICLFSSLFIGLFVCLIRAEKVWRGIPIDFTWGQD